MLPKHILKAAEQNKTSIGDNPCLPPEDEKNFIVKLLTSYYDELSSKIEIKDISELKNELNALIIKTKKIETQYKNDLEKICVECVNELFNIPEDTIDLNVSLVNKVDTSTERLYPESNDKYEFETISDMDNLTQEIYKRRFLNSLISGAALYYAGNFKPYFQKVFEINDELPSLYKKIMLINNILLFLEKDTIDISENNDGGKVNVFISNNENLVQIKSEAILFPILLNETIKGLLELSISHGLPEDREKANYIISKSDFKFAELWDLRLGVPLWERFLKLAKKNDINLEEVGINFFTMDLASISPDNFNVDVKEMLAGTKRGSEVLQNMCRSIVNSKEEDEFNDYMTTQQNNQIQITDDDYFEADELITDSLNENLLTEDRESKNMSKARKYIRSVNPNVDAQQMIDAIRTDIPNSRIADCKFLMGVSRMYLNGELNDQRTIRQLNQTLKLVGSNAHVNEYDNNLNNETAQSLIERFATSVQAELDNQRNDVNSEQYQENGNYQIIPIDSFEEAEKYGDYTDWCVTHYVDMYETYTNGGTGRFYFCLRNGFENEEEVEGENCPLDSYGLSMIAVSVNEDGSCNTITCRWNHDNGGNDNVMTDKELSRLIGRNFYQVFKPYTEEEISAKGIITVTYAKELLAQGVNPVNIFDNIDDFYNGFARVKLNGKYNFINTEGQLVSNQWFYYVDNFREDFAIVGLNDKYNFINTKGEYLFSTWFDDAGFFYGGFAIVGLNDKYNFINTKGEYLFSTWFDDVGFFNGGFARVKLNDKYNFINTKGEYLFSTWFDDAGFFNGGFARVKLNDKRYYIDTKGQLYDYETKRPISFQNESLQRRNKKRVIKLKESELRKMVVESIREVLSSL